MSIEWMLNTLQSLGLTQTDALIYVYLAAKGPKNRKKIEESLNLSKYQLDQSLKHLHGKGLVSLVRSVTFSAVSLEQALNSLLEKGNEQADNLEKNREAILSYWRNLTRNR